MHMKFRKRLRALGVVIGRGSATKRVLRVQPPLCIQSEDVIKVCDSLEEIGRQWKDEKGL